ncbi:TetR/AcrR family transcriptional regulator [Mangrovibacterium diazotrophicum]|uniref:TetR family transcriptional regulator n=1 Tax=Mangrovibacterium diazotrophicum TaxID=1261403 RepID=A0A419VUE3_9BACT|nr:TetR/AcrR family transcriptional regulator [Mangrovibacterium diazotrophicum]RKD85119.1 TetR family transcriptional regulator [Mangrovibacterium diazotrophicum]
MSKAERTRQFIIEKAAPIINRKGMAGASLSDIMEATGLAKGCIYGNFENKDEICLEAFNYLSQSYVNKLKEHLQNFTGAKAKLLAYLDYTLAGKLRDEMGGCPVINFGAESDDTHPAIRERVKQVIQSSREAITNLLREGVENGEFSAGLNCESQALKFYVMLEGAVIISRIENNREQLEQIVNLIKTEIETF